MTTIEAIRTELLASPAVVALVGDRIFPLVQSQGAAVPSLVLTVISDAPTNSFTGAQDTRLREVRLQVDSYASTYLGAQALAEVVDGVLANLLRHDLSAERAAWQDLYDNESNPPVHRVSADYVVFR